VTTGRWLRPAICFALLGGGAVTPGAARADGAGRVQDGPGLAVGVEAGRYGGGFGAALAYYQPLPVPRLAVGAGAGLGFSGGSSPALAGGVNGFAAYGRQHRALLVAGYAVVDHSSLELHGTTATERSYWGPEAGAGYEIMSATGPLVRLLVGLAYRPWQASASGGGDRLRTTLTLAVGWKLW
jgi:hypothetical protein